MVNHQLTVCAASWKLDLMVDQCSWVDCFVLDRVGESNLVEACVLFPILTFRGSIKRALKQIYVMI